MDLQREINSREDSILITAESLLKALPKLGRSEMTRYYHSLGHRTCVKLLQKGFIRAFTELHSVIEQNAKAIERKHMYEVKVLTLEKYPEKLARVRKSLVDAEVAHRKGEWGREFQAKSEAAMFFHQLRDYWLSEYLFASCQSIMEKVRYNKDIRTALIHYELGIHAEYRKDLVSALLSLEKAQVMIQGRSWPLPLLNDSLERVVPLALHRVCIEYGKKLQNSKPQQALRLYSRALEVATAAGDKVAKALAHQMIGNVLEVMGKTDKSRQHLLMLAQLSIECKNDYTLCLAYQSLARIYKSEGEWEVAMDFLYKCVTVSKESHMDNTLISVRTTLAIIYMSQGRFLEAFEQSALAYHSQIRNLEAEGEKQFMSSVSCNMSRVMYGIAKGHVLLKEFSELMKKEDNLKKILDWKSGATHILQTFSFEKRHIVLESGIPEEDIIEEMMEGPKGIGERLRSHSPAPLITEEEIPTVAKFTQFTGPKGPSIMFKSQMRRPGLGQTVTYRPLRERVSPSSRPPLSELRSTSTLESPTATSVAGSPSPPPQ